MVCTDQVIRFLNALFRSVINNCLTLTWIDKITWIWKTGYLNVFMACFYGIYRYMFSKWRSMRPVEINQYKITMIPLMTSQWAMTLLGMPTVKSQWVIMLLGTTNCDVTMRNGISMCTYHDIIMHNDVTMKLFYYVFSALCLIVLFYEWVVWNENKNKFMFDQSMLENTFIVFV